MFANERQNEINELIKRNGAVTTSDLSRKFSISVETVRKDLMILEKQNLLKRVHGGAVAIKEMAVFSKLSQRNEEHSEQKKELAFTASDFVCENDTIAVDSGSTAIHFANAIKSKFSNLTIVTPSLDVFNILSDKKGFRIILTGGEFLKSENTFVGPLTLNVLKNVHVSKSFVFVSGISLEYGICDVVPEIFEIQKQLIECGSEIYISADSSKFEKPALLKLDDMTNRYTYITDNGLSDELQNLYRENGLIVVKGAKNG